MITTVVEVQGVDARAGAVIAVQGVALLVVHEGIGVARAIGGGAPLQPWYRRALKCLGRFPSSSVAQAECCRASRMYQGAGCGSERRGLPQARGVISLASGLAAWLLSAALPFSRASRRE